MYTLHRPGPDYKIAVVELDRLKAHEEIIPSLTGNLANSIQEKGSLEHPVIVDGKNFVVLDGTHRIEALGEIGCRAIPVCLVDYQDPQIEVKSCDRIACCDVEEVLDLSLQMGFSNRAWSAKEVGEVIHRRGAELALISTGGAHLLRRGADSLREISRSVVELERKLKSLGVKVEYSTETGVPRKAKSEVTIIKMPPASKEEVIDAALSGGVFAPKTTRHVIPARPMHVCAPLDWLRKKDADEADMLLSKRLRGSELKRIRPEEYSGDRVYEEELRVFGEPSDESHLH